MEKWEYRTIKVELEGFAGGILNTEDFSSELNSLGEQGWELVSCFGINATGFTRDAVAVFKRRKLN